MNTSKQSSTVISSLLVSAAVVWGTACKSDEISRTEADRVTTWVAGAKQPALQRRPVEEMPVDTTNGNPDRTQEPDGDITNNYFDPRLNPDAPPPAPDGAEAQPAIVEGELDDSDGNPTGKTQGPAAEATNTGNMHAPTPDKDVAMPDGEPETDSADQKPNRRIQIDGNSLVFTPEQSTGKPTKSQTESGASPPSGGNKPKALELPPVPGAPKTVELPDIDGLVKFADKTEDKNIKSVLTGRWRQTSESNGPDYLEGGYTSSEVEFTVGGELIMRRAFGKQKSFVLTRQTDFDILEGEEILIGRENPLKSEDLIDEAITLSVGEKGEVVQVSPATNKLPLKIEYKIKDDTLRLGNKIYARIPVKKKSEE